MDVDPHDYPQLLVVAEVEVVFFNVSTKRGLMVGALGKGVNGRRELLRGLVAPSEQPRDTARRLLEDVARVRTAAHDPVFVSARAAPHRQVGRPTLTLSYVVLGAVPSNWDPQWDYSEVVDEPGEPLDARVDDADAVRAARQVAVRLLDELPVAPALLPGPDRPFTLAQLRWVYSSIIGPDMTIDVANFRRKIEQTRGLVEKVIVPPYDRPGPSRRGRPPVWYVRGDAGIIDLPRMSK